MIERKQILDVLDRYELDKIKIGMIASHSALDVCDGAIEEGFRTISFCQSGRERTYTKYFKAQRDGNGKILRGLVDEFVILNKFKDIMLPENQKMLIDNNVLFIPNRSFTSYADITEIEDNFLVPMVGSRNLLRSEERGEDRDYYWLLEKANLPSPERIKNPEDIEELVMVKLPHAVKKLERGFFSAATYKEYLEKSGELLRQGVITQQTLNKARIEKYIIGPVFNFDFFYSPLEDKMEKIELIGVDWRFETSLDGHVRLPAPQQMTLSEKQFMPEYTVCGHNSATLREDLC
jgi:5-formaminoimidazole-4-carboxamide-1-(beta)-D-ribofuranosyl 5'-monophosphate synthetase